MDTQAQNAIDQAQLSEKNVDAPEPAVPLNEILENKGNQSQSNTTILVTDKKDTDNTALKPSQQRSKPKNSATQKETDGKDTPSSEMTLPDSEEKPSTTVSPAESTDQSASLPDQPPAPDKNPLHEDPDFLKLQDSFDETRKWGRDLSKKLHGFKRQVESYLQEGILTEEEAQSLLKGTETHTEEEDHPLVTYSKIWDQEIHNIKKYTKDETVDQNILAFQHLLKHADQDELSSLLEELALVDKDPLELTHKMLQMGKDYHASTYGPLMEAGGMQNLLKIHQKETHKLQQQIDKLSQELVKLKRSSETSSRLDTAGYSLPDGGSFGTITGDTLSLGGILKKGLSGR